ncbi:hypothetical protein M0R72_02760 [Candidatus Pacearchaeota archaeon]|jgi:hypothetical protein|nr:hypothetical protein [Candidatus Pacearchaeota archaeon]
MTAQQPEILIIDGEELEMVSNPSLHDKAEAGWSTKTSNYRGYVGEWEIVDNKLYLNRVVGGVMKGKGPFFADWVSQELHVWKGNLLNYVHAGYGSMYEEDMFLSINGGLLKSTVIESNVEKFKAQALREVQEANSKQRIQYLYGTYLDPRGSLSRLIEKSTDRKKEYTDLKNDLEFDFKQRLIILSEDPNSGIKLVYK